MTTWNTLYILNSTTNKKMWNSSVSDAALPGAIRELERHMNNIQDGAKGYESFKAAECVMFVNDNIHNLTCVKDMSDEDLLAELIG